LFFSENQKIANIANIRLVYNQEKKNESSFTKKTAQLNKLQQTIFYSS